jgi:hypothetical protein
MVNKGLCFFFSTCPYFIALMSSCGVSCHGGIPLRSPSYQVTCTLLHIVNPTTFTLSQICTVYKPSVSPGFV